MWSKVTRKVLDAVTPPFLAVGPHPLMPDEMILRASTYGDAEGTVTWHWSQRVVAGLFLAVMPHSERQRLSYFVWWIKQEEWQPFATGCLG